MELIRLQKYPDDWLVVVDGRADFAKACLHARAHILRPEVQAVVVHRASATLKESGQQISQTMNAHSETKRRNFIRLSDGSYQMTDGNGEYMSSILIEDFGIQYGPDLSQTFNALSRSFPELNMMELRNHSSLFGLHIDENYIPKEKDESLEAMRGGIFAVESIQGGGSIIVRSFTEDFKRSSYIPVYILPHPFHAIGRERYITADGDLIIMKGRHWESPCIHSANDTYGRIVAVYHHAS